MIGNTVTVMGWVQKSRNKGYCDYFYTCVDDSGWSTPGWYGALLSADALDGAGCGGIG